MKALHILPFLFTAVLLAGCATTTTDRSPMTSYDQGGGGAGIITTVLFPKDKQVFPAGKDIPLKAGANCFSSINRVIFFVNGRQIASDWRRPYTAVISKPKPGTYVIHSVAYDMYGSSRSSMGIVITVQ